MPLFIALNLTFAYLVQTKSPYQAVFISDIALYAGIAFIFIGLSGALLKVIKYKIWYDLFASGSVLSWFSYWHQFYSDETPMFYMFPLFFAFFTALVHILYISKKDRFDQESVEQLEYFSKMTRFHPGLIVAGILISLVLVKHYLLFPVLIIIFTVRYTMTSCLDGYDQT